MAHKARICIFVAISDPDSTAAQIGGYASSHDCRVSCSQQSPGVQRLGLVAGPAALARQETGGPLCAVRADLPGLCGGIEDACGPKSPGFHPGGLGPHLTSSGFPWRAFLRFPVCPPRFVPGARLRMVSLRRRSPVVPFGRRPVRVPLRVPFPRAILTLALPRGGAAGVGPGRQGPRSPVLPRPPRLGRPRSAHAAGGQRPGTRDAAAESPGTSGRERMTSPRPAAIAECDTQRWPAEFVIAESAPLRIALQAWAAVRRLSGSGASICGSVRRGCQLPAGRAGPGAAQRLTEDRDGVRPIPGAGDADHLAQVARPVHGPVGLREPGHGRHRGRGPPPAAGPRSAQARWPAVPLGQLHRVQR